jgi:TIR domain
VNTRLSTIPSLFCSYAHEDKRHLQALRKSLALLKRERKIADWYDGEILPGDEWRREIADRLESSRIILFLVSPDFIASDYCWGIEVQRALARRERNVAVVVPVIVRPTDWRSAPFGDLQALPPGGRPVTAWANRDEAWREVATGIRILIDHL